MDEDDYDEVIFLADCVVEEVDLLAFEAFSAEIDIPSGPIPANPAQDWIERLRNHGTTE